MPGFVVTIDYLRSITPQALFILYRKTKLHLDDPPSRIGGAHERAERLERLSLMEQVAKERGIDLNHTATPVELELILRDG